MYRNIILYKNSISGKFIFNDLGFFSVKHDFKDRQ